MRFSVLYDRINQVHIRFISPTIKLVVKKPCGAFLFLFTLYHICAIINSELSKAYQEKEKIYSSNPSMEIEAAERLDTINTLILTPTGEEFKQAKLNLNHWKNYDNLSRADYFNQSKIEALVAPVKKVKKW